MGRRGRGRARCPRRRADARRQLRSHERTIHFVLRPDASVSNRDLPGALDALKSDGALVQTVIGVLSSDEMLRRAAARLRRHARARLRGHVVGTSGQRADRLDGRRARRRRGRRPARRRFRARGRRLRRCELLRLRARAAWAWTRAAQDTGLQRDAARDARAAAGRARSASALVLVELRLEREPIARCDRARAGRRDGAQQSGSPMTGAAGRRRPRELRAGTGAGRRARLLQAALARIEADHAELPWENGVARGLPARRAGGAPHPRRREPRRSDLGRPRPRGGC